MKIFRIYVTECKNLERAKEYYFQKRNRQIDLKNFKFISKYSPQLENACFEIGTIKFDEKLVDSITKTISLSAKKTQLLKGKNLENDKLTGVEKYKDGIKSLVNSLAMKYSHNDECFDVFDFITDLFIKLLNNHIFHNGNKRTSIISLRTILWDFGYYFKWSSGDKYIYEKIYEDELKYFISRLQRINENLEKENFEKIRNEIKFWIFNNIVIGLNFRKK